MSKFNFSTRLQKGTHPIHEVMRKIVAERKCRAAADLTGHLRFVQHMNHQQIMLLVREAGLEPAAWDQMVAEGEAQQ